MLCCFKRLLKCENKLRKQEWLKVQHLIKCLDLCHFFMMHHISSQDI